MRHLARGAMHKVAPAARAKKVSPTEGSKVGDDASRMRISPPAAGEGQLCGQPCATRWGGQVLDAHVAMRSRAGGTRWVWTAAGRWGGMSGCRRMSGWPHLTATASRCRSQ